MFAKARRRFCVLFAGALFALLFAATPALAQVEQTGTPTTTSFTVKWDQWTPSSSSYSFKNYEVLVGKDSSSARVYQTITSSNITSCTVSGLRAGAKRYVQVKANYVYTSYNGTKYEYDSYVGSISDAKTLPGVVKGLKQERWWYFALSFDAKWNAIESADGYQWICYKDNGRKFRSGTLTYGFSKPTVSVNKIKNNQIYKMKVRAFTTINGKKYYGGWSAFSYFFTQPRVTKAKVAGGKLTVRWGRVTGATSYSVYVSTRAKKGYKKVATVGKGRSSVTIKKLAGKEIKNGKKYYVYVITNKKIRGKVNTSGRLYYWDTKSSSFQYF